MKHLTDIVLEHVGQPIDDQWINDEKPVMTKDGRQVKVLSVDMTKVPNVVLGQVVVDDKVFNYEWNDDGTCIKATDSLGNSSKPSDDDNLVKAS